MQVLVDQFAAIGILRTDGGVIGALRGGKTLFGETQWAPRIWVDNGVFLLKAEPEIVVVVVNGRPAVAGVCAAVGLFGRLAVKRPDRRVGEIAGEIVNDLGFATQALGRVVAVEPDVF